MIRCRPLFPRCGGSADRWSPRWMLRPTDTYRLGECGRSWLTRVAVATGGYAGIISGDPAESRRLSILVRQTSTGKPAAWIPGLMYGTVIGESDAISGQGSPCGILLEQCGREPADPHFTC